MAGQTKEKSVCNGGDMFTMQEIRDERKLTRIRNLPVDQIVDFPDHPYRVRDDEDMTYLVESIRANGVLTPVTVRKIPGGRYEMISGHRRKKPPARSSVSRRSGEKSWIWMRILQPS